MACHSDLVGQILYFCVPIKILDQKSILSEIHVHGPWSFNAAEEVALGSIKAIILNLLYLLSSFHIVPVIFATCNTYPVGVFLALGVNSLGFILVSAGALNQDGVPYQTFPSTSQVVSANLTLILFYSFCHEPTLLCCSGFMFFAKAPTRVALLECVQPLKLLLIFIKRYSKWCRE